MIRVVQQRRSRSKIYGQTVYGAVVLWVILKPEAIPVADLYSPCGAQPTLRVWTAPT
jgi:hypothetical protein